MSAPDELLEAARGAVAAARAQGAREAAAVTARTREVEVEWRDGRLEKIREATTRSLSLRLYVDGRYVAVSTSDLRPDAVQRFIGGAVSMARTLSPDPHRCLPDPARYEAIDLRIDDPGQEGLAAIDRRRRAEALEAASREVKGSIQSVTSRIGDNRTELARVHSNGFEGARRETSFWMSAEVSVKDPDGRRPMESASRTARHLADLPPIAEIGHLAGDLALGRLGAKKLPSAVLPMVVENRVAAGLVSRLLGPLSGAALQQKRSVFEGKLGATIGSAILDVADDPLIPKGLGSRLFDGEGLAARRFPLFERGVLRGYYVDHYYGKKLGTPATTAGPSNLAFTLGDKDGAGLIAGLDDAILVTGFLGGNSNATTGDFSLGVSGFRIRKGARAEPISEMNIAGNHLELWKRLVAAGNDPYLSSALRPPTLLFDAVQFAGA